MSATFPNLTQCVRFMLQDNYGSQYKSHVLPETRWAFDTLGNVGDLEAQAAALTTEDRETMAAGEESEQKAIVKKHKCAALNDALARMFDGDLEHLVKKPAQPAKPTKPATAKKPAKEAAAQPKAKPAKEKGKTVRVRILEALATGKTLTAGEVQKAIGLGHGLKPTMDQEVERGHLETVAPAVEGGPTTYKLTAAGKKALKDGTVDPKRGGKEEGK